jgi:hypothetical protein
VRYQGESASAALSYVYSGVTVTPTPFDPAVLSVLGKLRELFPEDGPGLKLPPFNTCLLNYYRSGASAPVCGEAPAREQAAEGVACAHFHAAATLRCADTACARLPAAAGDDKLGWHDDWDKKRYGVNPVIASVSFGSERAFQMRRKADNSDKYEFQLGGGAILVMAGSCQATWEHSVPARAKAPGERINLTFRHVIV